MKPVTFLFCSGMLSVLFTADTTKHGSSATIPANEHRESYDRGTQGHYRRKVIIDTDAGVDDAQAILMILANADVEVMAITCVDGNTVLKFVERNVLQTLSIANRDDVIMVTFALNDNLTAEFDFQIPVHTGASAHFVLEDNSTFESPPYFGEDGFGEVDAALMPLVNISRIGQEPAAHLIVRLAKRYPQEITLLAIGPLTNLALAILLEPNLTSYLKAIIVLGGNNAGEGNETPAAEFNFHRDPEAAAVVLKELGCLISLINWEACLQTANIDQKFKLAFYNSSTPQGQFIGQIANLTNEQAFAQAALQGTEPVFLFGDQVAAALLLDDSLCAESAFWPTEVELAGRFTRGQCVVDKRGLLPSRANLRNCHTINLTIVRDHLQQMIDFDFTNVT